MSTSPSRLTTSKEDGANQFELLVSRNRTRAAAFGDDAAIVDVELFERLRDLRKRLADENGVPAYIVFSDATLKAMAELRPASAEELLGVPGVGPAKLERYGAAFLAELS